MFVRTHFEVPAIEERDHRLRVEGAVRRPLDLALADLRRWRSHRVEVTLECAGNGRSLITPPPAGTPWGLGAIGNAVFEGVALGDVLEDAGLGGGALEVLASGADAGKVASGTPVPFERSLPLAVALEPGVLLAREMNGAPLRPEHGHPLRLVVPGWYGVASVKWLSRLAVLTEPFAGWFQRSAYVYDGEPGLPDGTPVGPMRVRSLLTSPEDGAVIPAGPVGVRGAAWSGAGAIVAVELSADEGASWTAMELASTPPTGLRQLWHGRWTPPGRGRYTLLTRATDASGAVQPLQASWNRLGYGNNAVQRVRVTVS